MRQTDRLNNKEYQVVSESHERPRVSQINLASNILKIDQVSVWGLFIHQVVFGVLHVQSAECFINFTFITDEIHGTILNSQTGSASLFTRTDCLKRI